MQSRSIFSCREWRVDGSKPSLAKNAGELVSAKTRAMRRRSARASADWTSRAPNPRPAFVGVTASERISASAG